MQLYGTVRMKKNDFPFIWFILDHLQWIQWSGNIRVADPIFWSDTDPFFYFLLYQFFGSGSGLMKTSKNRRINIKTWLFFILEQLCIMKIMGP